MCAFTASEAPAKSAIGEFIDLDPVRPNAHIHVGLLRLEAGDNGTTYLERERNIAWPVEGRIPEQRLAQRIDAVEIDFRRGDGGVEPRWPLVASPGIGHASVDVQAIKLKLESLDRDRVAAERDIGAKAPRTDGRHSARCDPSAMQ